MSKGKLTATIHVPANGWTLSVTHTIRGRERRRFVKAGTYWLDDLLKAVR